MFGTADNLRIVEEKCKEIGDMIYSTLLTEENKPRPGITTVQLKEALEIVKKLRKAQEDYNYNVKQIEVEQNQLNIEGLEVKDLMSKMEKKYGIMFDSRLRKFFRM